jgi:catechol 2,3-dioxygenase-like lactoylglutathione lyase family enzyme
MIHHVSLGVSDLERAAAFYDAVLTPLGYRRTFEVEGVAIAYGEKLPEFWIGRPLDASRPVSAGNGTHIAFAAPSRDAIAQFHVAALDNGAADEGAPGPRPQYGPDYYGAFVRDPDGNKIEACLNQPG